MQNAFFSLNKNLLQKEFIGKIQLCIICTHKIELSSEIVREYTETCNRNNTASAKKCFFCEDKVAQLIDFNENPIEAEEKINVFLSSVNIKRNYKDLKSCIRCLYNLATWTEMRSKLSLKMNLPDIQSPRNDKTRGSHTPKTIETKTTSAIRPSKNTTLDKNGNTTNAGVDAELLTTPNRKGRARSHRTIGGNDNQKLHWYKYLRGKLKGFQTVNKMVQNGDIVVNLTNMENKEKLFHKLPFVEILISSQISEDRILQKGATNKITIDNSKDKLANKTPKRKLNLSITKKGGPKEKHKRTPIRKNKIKFKMPMKRSLPIKAVPTTQSGSQENISDDSDKSDQVISSETEPENDFMCEVCDKSFTVKCDYLAHRLKHDKMEEVIVNVLRHNLPIQVNVAELSPKHDVKEIVSSANINRLLAKWIGENAAQLYKDTDESANKSTEEIIEAETGNVGTSKDKEADSNSIGSDDFNKSGTDDRSGENEGDKMDVDATENSEDMAEINESNEIKSNNESDIENNSNRSSEEINKIGANDEHRIQEEEKAESETKDQASDKDTDDLAIPISDSDDDVQCINGNDKEVQDSDKSESCVNEKSSHENSEEQNTDANSKESDSDDTNSIVGTETAESSEKDNADENNSMSTETREVSPSKSDEDEDDKLESIKDDNVVESNKNNDGNCEDADTENKEKVDRSDNFDEFSNSDLVSPPVMTCEDLLNILETNIDPEEADVNNDNASLTEPGKRKRETDNEDDTTPKRKKVRFADKKQIFSSNEDGVLLEKVVENIHSVQEDEELEEKES
ncbi:hypothetical protein Trydic_g7242 [Trypoxylus dichotomus]